MSTSSCDAKIRPMRPLNEVELVCEHRGDVVHAHRATLRDYAYEGSETAIEWVEADRRMFRGKWRSCRNDGCIRPAGHQGRHAE
jgi:hypothetical protein